MSAPSTDQHDRAHSTEMEYWILAQPSNISLTKQTRGDLHLPSLALRLQQSKDVLHTHRALDVTDDRAGAIVHELDTDLRDASSRSSAAENLCIQRSTYYYPYR